MQTEIPIRLKAFVGRSFADEDKSLWHQLRDLLDSYKRIGFVYEDAREFKVRPVSSKVRELIRDNEIYIGMLTRRELISSAPCTFANCFKNLLQPSIPQRWTTSSWVIEEVGYAIGKDRPVVLLIENGVEFPTSDLDGDTQWIPFLRTNLEGCTTDLTQAINGLIEKRLPAPVIAAATASEKPRSENVEPLGDVPKDNFGEQLAALRKAATAGDYQRANQITEEILTKSEKSEKPGDKRFLESYLLEERAQRGDQSALNSLVSRVDANPSSHADVMMLHEAYVHLGQYNLTINMLRKSSPHVAADWRTNVILYLGFALRKTGKLDDALEVLTAQLRQESDEERKADLYLGIANVAKEQKNADLESACLERYLEKCVLDGDVKFRLAKLYTESQRNKLGIYHYELLSRTVEWPSAINNLAVSYGELKLRGAEVEQYLKVVEQLPLAKANVASLYANAGFLEQARLLARDALNAAGDDETAIERANYVLGEVVKTRDAEGKAIAAIADETRDEREFMARYANALQDEIEVDFSATFKTPHAKLEIIKSGKKIIGEATFTEKHTVGLIGAVMAGIRSGRDEPNLRTIKVELNGSCCGRSAEYKLDIRPVGDGSSAASTLLTEKKINGLLIFSDDLQSYTALERSEGKTTIYRADTV